MALDLVARLSFKDDFTSKFSKVADNMNKTERATSSLSSGFKGFTKQVAGISSAIGLTYGLAKGFGMVRDSVGSAFDRIDTMESFGRSMTVFTGSAQQTQEALEKIRESVTGTAYGMDVAAKGVQDFVTRGMEIDKATNTMGAWADAVAFYGDGSNAQLESVSDALAKMYSSGKVGMDQMDRLYNAGINGVGMYAQAVGRDVDAVQRDLSNGTISAEDFISTVGTAMMEGTNGVVKIAGAAKEAGASWGASFENMRAAVTRGTVSIIENIDEMLTSNGLPDMRTMIADFGSTFENTLNKAADSVPAVTAYLVDLYEKSKPAIEWVRDGIGEMTEKAKEMYAFITGNWSMIKPVVIGLAVSMGSLRVAFMAMSVIGTVTKWMDIYRKGLLKTTIAKKSLTAAMLMNPMTWWIAGIVALVAAGVLLWRNWDTVKEKALELWGVVTGVWNSLKESAISAFTTMGAWIAEKFTQIGQWISEKIGQAYNFIVWYFTQMPYIVAEKLGYMLGVAVLWLSQLPGKFMQFLSESKDRLVWVLTEMPGIIITYLSQVVSNAVTWLSNLASKFTEWFTKSKDNAIEQVSQLPGKIGEFLSQIPGKVKSAASAIWTAFKDLGASIPRAIADGFNAAIGGLGNAARWAVDKIAGGMGNLRDLGTSFGSGLSAGMSANGSHYHGLDHVPYDGYTARLHKGERVLTAQENREYTNGGGSGGGSPISINIAKMEVREDNDIKRIAEELAHMLIQGMEAGA